MKVRDLIRDTVWCPGFGYSADHKPAVSVLLPTFRRGTSGLFRKAVESVLNQTLRDVELIIVDDASVDGTADQIAEFMKADGRVSCLRHPHNIGLPAISEFEAYMRARADYIAFAFDDDYFCPDALEKLLRHSIDNPGKICFGNAVYSFKPEGSATEQIVKLGQPLTSYNLRSWNSIANCAVLLPRAICEDIGLYDPHIVMARICDWGLWRRISERYVLHHVDVDVGVVTGSSTTDSLGNTYVYPAGASEEWMRLKSNLSLVDYPDLDVFAAPEQLSLRTKATIADLAREHVRQRPHLQSEKSPPEAQDKTIFVLTSSHDASTTLCFDYLPLSLRGKLRILRSPGGFPLSELASASCVIVIRQFAAHESWIAAAKELGIPLYFFLDDNVPELVSRENLVFVGSEDFSSHRLRVKLCDFTGVLVSSIPLLEYFDAHLLHPNVRFFPVSYASAPLRIPRKTDQNGDELIVASIGGRHRRQGLQDCVLPALRRIANKAYPIHLIVGGCRAEDFDDLKTTDEINENIRLTLLPFEVDWSRVLLHIAQFRPDILVHAPSRTLNNKYKTLNVALCAYLLDSVLLVPNDPPYDAEVFAGAAARVSPADEPRAWLDALRDLISARDTWDGYRRTNAMFCRTHFSGEQNIIALKEILESAPAITPTLVEARLQKLYHNKSAAGGVSTFDTEPLRMSLLELSRLRAKLRTLRRIRPRWSHEDIWPRLSPAFEDIRQYIQKERIRSPGRYLELSDSIHEKAHREYPILLRDGRLKCMTCAFSSEGLHDGTIGMELVAPNGAIAFQSTLDLAPMNLHLPVTFDLKNTLVSEPGMWQLRLSARSRWPIYILEFAQYSLFGLIRKTAAPFAKIEYAASS